MSCPPRVAEAHHDVADLVAGEGQGAAQSPFGIAAQGWGKGERFCKQMDFHGTLLS
jgi:hypothetical protein